jgi:hypothetical protein
LAVKKTGYPVGGNTAWSHGVLKEKKFQITIIEGFRFQVSVRFQVSGFSVQVSDFLFFFPDTRHLTPDTLRFGAWNLIFCNAPLLQYSIISLLHFLHQELAKDAACTAPSGAG